MAFSLPCVCVCVCMCVLLKNLTKLQIRHMSGGLLNISDKVKKKKAKLLSVIKLNLRTLVELKCKRYNQASERLQSH